MGEKPGKKRQQIKKVLVVGDWVVDDYWVTGVHRSLRATRPGQHHSRALHDSESDVQALGGAGRTAFHLFNARPPGGSASSRERLFEVAGLGLWHDGDTNIIGSMFDPDRTVSWTPLQLRRPGEEGLPGTLKLCNIGKAIPEEPAKKGGGGERTSGSARCYGTMRMLRTYEQRRGQLDVIQRIDWELPAPDYFPEAARDGAQVSCPGWVQDDFDLNEFDKLLERAGIGAEWKEDPNLAIVIHDLAKGVITDRMITALKKRFRKAKWFVSTKLCHPYWLQELVDVDVDLRLLVLRPAAANRAIQDGEVRSWITDSRRPSSDALKALDAIRRMLWARNSDNDPAAVVVFPDQLSAVGVDFIGDTDGAKSEDDVVFCQPDPQPDPLKMQVGISSSAFASMVANMLVNPGVRLNRILGTAIRDSVRFMDKQCGRLLSPGGATGTEGADSHSITLFREDGPESGVKVRREGWKKEQLRAQEAAHDVGIIKADDGRCRLELWRAWQEVGEYVCWAPRRRAELALLKRKLQDFSNAGRGRRGPQFSAMLLGDPGAGKSFLVRRLAERLGYQLLTFNITQMYRLEHVLDCFDKIVTVDAQDPSHRVLALFDEINAPLEGQSVYSSFLAPLEDSLYVRSEKKFYLPSTAWVFAGTQEPGGDPLATKWADFRSRLTLNIVDLRTQGSAHDDISLERVYTGAALIRNRFPDVREVSESVLWFFATIEWEGLSIRDLRGIVSQFVDVQHARVTEKNLPMEQVVGGQTVREWLNKAHPEPGVDWHQMVELVE